MGTLGDESQVADAPRLDAKSSRSARYAVKVASDRPRSTRNWFRNSSMAAWSRSVSTATMPRTSPLPGCAPPLFGAAEQLLGARPRGRAALGSGEHLGQLSDSPGLVEPLHAGHRAAFSPALLDAEVGVRVSRDLAEVRDAQNLVGARE